MQQETDIVDVELENIKRLRHFKKDDSSSGTTTTGRDVDEEATTTWGLTRFGGKAGGSEVRICFNAFQKQMNVLVGDSAEVKASDLAPIVYEHCVLLEEEDDEEMLENHDESTGTAKTSYRIGFGRNAGAAASESAEVKAAEQDSLNKKKNLRKKDIRKGLKETLGSDIFPSNTDFDLSLKLANELFVFDKLAAAKRNRRRAAEAQEQQDDSFYLDDLEDDLRQLVLAKGTPRISTSLVNGYFSYTSDLVVSSLLLLPSLHPVPSLPPPSLPPSFLLHKKLIFWVLFATGRSSWEDSFATQHAKAFGSTSMGQLYNGGQDFTFPFAFLDTMAWSGRGQAMVDKNKLFEQTRDLIFSDTSVRVMQKHSADAKSGDRDGSDELAPLRFLKRQAEEFLIKNSDAPFTTDELAFQLIQGLEKDDQNSLAETLAFDVELVERLYAKRVEVLAAWKKAQDQFGSAKSAAEQAGKYNMTRELMGAGITVETKKSGAKKKRDVDPVTLLASIPAAGREGAIVFGGAAAASSASSAMSSEQGDGENPFAARFAPVGTRATALPIGTTRMEKAGNFERVDVPPPKDIIIPDPNNLVPISDLPDWAQPAFAGTDRLNTVQSKVYKAAYDTIQSKVYNNMFIRTTT